MKKKILYIVMFAFIISNITTLEAYDEATNTNPTSAINEAAITNGVGSTFAQQFPDPRMASVVAEYFQKDVDDSITQTMIDATTYLNLSSNQIQSAEGIELFVNLQTLYLEDNQLTNFDGKSLINLKYLYLHNNQLTSFDGKSLINLKYLILNDNQLTSFDGTGLKNLEVLNLGYNQLTNFSGNEVTNLQILNLENNQLTNFDGEALKNLEDLYLKDNQLTSFNETGLENLTWLDLQNNPLGSFSCNELKNLRNLFLTGCSLTSFDGSGLHNLEYLHLNKNQLTSFSGNGLDNLYTLLLQENQLLSFDGSNLDKLVELSIYDNQLTSFNTDGLTNIKYIYLHKNKLTDFDTSKLTTLYYITLSENQLLDVPVESYNKLYNSGLSAELENQIYEAQIANSYIKEAYTFDSLPIFEQVNTYGDGSMITFELNHPDGTTSFISPTIINGQFIIDASELETSGAYELVATISGGKMKNSTYTLKFNLQTSTPTIALLGDNPQKIKVNNPYQELGASANDHLFGDITGDIKIDASAVDTTKVGKYKVQYTVTNAHGNTASITRMVHVIEETGVTSNAENGNTGITMMPANTPNTADTSLQIGFLLLLLGGSSVVLSVIYKKRNKQYMK